MFYNKISLLNTKHYNEEAIAHSYRNHGYYKGERIKQAAIFKSFELTVINKSKQVDRLYIN